MVKEQFREANIGSVISHVQFMPFSSKDMGKQATLQVVNRNLYLADAAHKACPYGVLDNKLVNATNQSFISFPFLNGFIELSKGHESKRQEMRDVWSRVGHLYWPLRLHRSRAARLPRGLLSSVHKYIAEYLQKVLARSIDQTGEGQFCRNRQA